VHVIAESDLNDPRLVRPSAAGGYELDAMWSDDFHHALHALLTGESTGYYADFGRVQDLAAAMRDGMTYAGRHSAFRGRRHGRAANDLAPERFVVCAQNHDQVGNRLVGERLGALVDHEAQKLAAAAVLLSPHLPLLFMGEEYGERAPFLYFVSHGDPELIEAVRRGRKHEHAAFGWSEDAPDPQSPESFARSRLHRELRTRPRHAQLEGFYRDLILLRRQLAPCAVEVRAHEDTRVLEVWSREPGQRAAYWLVLAFGAEPRRLMLQPPFPARVFRKRLCSADDAYGGPGDALPEHITSTAEHELPATACAVYVSD
jgi:maltooligosyltrehalose trehalohydrolase